MNRREFLILGAAIHSGGAVGFGRQGQVRWGECLRQQPGWYAGEESRRIADNVLLYQRVSGGWPKNIDMAVILGPEMRAAVIDERERNDSTIDNGATTSQMIYLARVFNATGIERFKDGFTRGVDYLFAAQYPNGGWPQFYPRRRGYYSHITFNDNAMIDVMELLRSIARSDQGYGFIDAGRRDRAVRAVERGIESILKCQVRSGGRLTVWCAQHDEVTLAPAPARAFEKVSLSGSESVGIVRFLIRIEKPSPEVIASIEAAVAWFDKVRITGIKVVRRKEGPSGEWCNTVVAAEAGDPPLWARFYEIGTDRPIFSGRDGKVRYNHDEIECERRNGYTWYVEAPAKLLARDYPAWKKRRP